MNGAGAMWIVPARELRLETIIQARDEAVRILQDLIRTRGKDPRAYVIRDILPKTDLGLSNEEWKISYTSAYTWEDKVDKTLEEDKFLVIFGYQNNSATPKTTAIKFYKDVVPIEVVQVENLYTYDEPIGFFTPLAWSESERIKIEFYGNSAGDDYVILRGFVAELRRKTVA
jgi:hypothetical protein